MKTILLKVDLPAGRGPLQLIAKIVTALLFAHQAITGAQAQCLGLTSVEDLEARSGSRVTKLCPVPSIVNKINSEANFLRQVFGVNPNIFFVDDSGSPNAFAVPIDTLDGYYKTVTFGQNLVWSYHLADGEKSAALSVVMAHEWSHVLQFKWKPDLPKTGKARELHADYLAGYYFSRKQLASAPGWVSWPNVQTGAKALFDLGDYAFTSPVHHGTPAERLVAFDSGYSLALDKVNSGDISEVRELTTRMAFNEGVSFVKRLIKKGISGLKNKDDSR